MPQTVRRKSEQVINLNVADPSRDVLIPSNYSRWLMNKPNSTNILSYQ